METILIVEDDLSLGMGIALALKGEEIHGETVPSMTQAKLYLDHYSVALVILDLNLPDGNGLALLKWIKERGDTPVMILTANDMETDIVLGLESGADDYVTKPFSLAVLRARVHTQLRKKTHDPIFLWDDFRFDFKAMEFTKGDAPLELSKTEQKLLMLLTEHPGQTLSRETLVDRIWSEGGAYVDENALSVTVGRLRRKIGDDGEKPHYIQTVYGIGYGWVVKNHE